MVIRIRTEISIEYCYSLICEKFISSQIGNVYVMILLHLPKRAVSDSLFIQEQNRRKRRNDDLFLCTSVKA
jgi:hypothetical protein